MELAIKSPTTLSRGRIEELDGLRGLAVVAVLLWHFVGSLSPAESLVVLTVWGRTGVDLFFVLSGFLIIGILVDERKANNVLRTFYWRRLMRIYPPYIALIIAYWLCFAWFGQSSAFNTSGGFFVQLLAQITFTWNWLMAAANGAVAAGFSVTWSVAIEEWFYLVAPWILLAVPQQHLVKLLVSVGLFSILARAGAHLILGPDFLIAPYVLPPFRLDGLCAGGLLAVAIRSERFMLWCRGAPNALDYPVTIFTITIPIIIGSIYGNIHYHMYMWGHTYLTAGFTLVILWSIIHMNSAKTSFLRNPALRQAGRYSYTLYLFHPLFLSAAFLLGSRPTEMVYQPYDALLAALAFIASVLFSIAFYHLVERHTLRLGRTMNYSTSTLAP